jgi:phenylpropionate dioxygenase-like ring-hydroxylating dioxygenase large terminal subunit
MTETITGTNRSSGISLSELLDADSHPVSDILRNESRIGVREGNTRIPAWYYTSPDFHALEVEKLWSRVWQLACLEEEIPNVGDYHVYEIADMSFLIVRTADGIRAYRNACLHRGRRLRETNGHGAKVLRCAFHGWSWNLDGSLKEIPCEWDFPSVTADDYALPEASVGTWHGFVFVNPDPDAAALDEHLAGLDEHFAAYPFEQRVKVAHVEKIMPVNWKACQEAFMESYHVIATHPQILLTTGDANTQYDVYPGENGMPGWNRMLTPSGVASPHLGDDVDESTILQGMMAAYGMGDPSIEVPEGMTARHFMASMSRSSDPADTPASIPGELVSEAEAIDSILYFIFPNMQPWAGMSPINYRFRPYGDDPDMCIMDVIFLSDFTGERPAPAQVQHLGPDDDWTTAVELGALAMVFNQDTGNLPRVQRGLHATRRTGVPLGLYQESRLRQFHRDLVAFMEAD